MFLSSIFFSVLHSDLSLFCLTNTIFYSSLDRFAGQGCAGYDIHLTGLLFHDLVWNLFDRFIGNSGCLVMFQNSDRENLLTSPAYPAALAV